MRAPFEPRVALASLSGASDAAWASNVREHVGAAFLGGIALDYPTRAAARSMVKRDREEFLPTDPIAWIERELDALAEEPLRAGVNVRAATPGRVRAAATACARQDAILEINAHCRQAEMCAAGAGESLLQEPDRLREQVRAATETDATVGVKVRAAVGGVDLPSVTADAVRAGAEFVHVDAMDSEHVVGDVVKSVEASPGTDSAWVIANNGVRDRETVREYLELGADAVSVGRASDDPEVLARVRRATEEFVGPVEGSA